MWRTFDLRDLRVWQQATGCGSLTTLPSPTPPGPTPSLTRHEDEVVKHGKHGGAGLVDGHQHRVPVAAQLLQGAHHLRGTGGQAGAGQGGQQATRQRLIHTEPAMLPAPAAELCSKPGMLPPAHLFGAEGVQPAGGLVGKHKHGPGAGAGAGGGRAHHSAYAA